MKKHVYIPHEACSFVVTNKRERLLLPAILTFSSKSIYKTLSATTDNLSNKRKGQTSTADNPSSKRKEQTTDTDCVFNVRKEQTETADSLLHTQYTENRVAGRVWRVRKPTSPLPNKQNSY